MLVAAVLVAGIVYGYFAVNPYAHTPLKPFLAMFARSGAAAWPMQVLWWAVAGALVVLALSGVRHSERWVAALAGAYFAWVGIAFFAWLNPSMNLASLWAATFAVEGALFV
jgi:hypothetical protein